MSGVPFSVDELRGLVIRRNDIAHYLQNDHKLPPTLTDPHNCKHCHQLNNCTLFHKAVENGTVETSHMGDLFLDTTKHLNANHLAYFAKWNKLIELEKKDSLLYRKEIWSLTSSEREKLGRCFGGMVLESVGNSDSKYEYLFRKYYRPPRTSSLFIQTSNV
jgi:DNA replication ATP-dependent helicase Dna2